MMHHFNYNDKKMGTHDQYYAHATAVPFFKKKRTNC